MIIIKGMESFDWTNFLHWKKKQELHHLLLGL